MEDLREDLDIPGFDQEILKQMVSEAEDITDKLSEYGTLDDEEIQSIKENAERKEQRIQRIQTVQEPEPQSAVPLQQDPEGGNEETTEVRKFVTCPNCGGKIWL